MERRGESRITTGEPVTVTILSGEPSAHRAIVKNASGNGMALDMPVPVKAGAAIQIAFEDTLYLGQAVHCSAQVERFIVGVLLDTKLCQLSRLAQMLERFTDGEEPAWRPCEPRRGGGPRSASTDWPTDPYEESVPMRYPVGSYDS
jgi:hypothetical protein